MDQPSKTEETDNLDGPSTLHSPSPRHRPGHSGAHHHESQQRGETQQRGGFPHGGTQPHQDFLNIHDNATSFYHPGMSRHQGRHPHQPSTAFGLAPSSINAQHFHDEHHSRTQPGGILHHGGPQHHGRQHHHHGGPHPVIEPVSPQSGVSSNTMTSQHGRGHSQGVPHHLGGHHQQRDPSSQEYAPQQEEDHHRGESRQHGRPPLPDHSRGRSRKQRGENIPHTSSDTSSHPIPSHFCREQRGGPRPSEYYIRDRPANQYHSQYGASQMSIPRKPPLGAPSTLRSRTSTYSGTQSHVAIQSHPSQAQTTIKESETWNEDDRFHKRKSKSLPSFPPPILTAWPRFIHI